MGKTTKYQTFNFGNTKIKRELWPHPERPEEPSSPNSANTQHHLTSFPTSTLRSTINNQHQHHNPTFTSTFTNFHQLFHPLQPTFINSNHLPTQKNDEPRGLDLGILRALRIARAVRLARLARLVSWLAFCWGVFVFSKNNKNNQATNKQQMFESVFLLVVWKFV